MKLSLNLINKMYMITKDILSRFISEDGVDFVTEDGDFFVSEDYNN